MPLLRPSRPRTTTVTVGVLLLLFASLGVAASAQETAPTAPWYGLPLPPDVDPTESVVVVGEDYAPVPARVPPGEHRYRALEGERIREDLETIVDFAYDSYEAGDRFWGRIAGFPALSDTVEWAAEQYRDAGIKQVEVQRFEADEPMWVPEDWEVRLLAGPHVGGGEDVVLRSANPVDESATLPPEGLTARLVHVGTGRPAELTDVDVVGKVAVQHISPRQGVFFDRGRTSAQAAELIARGAVAVLNVVEQPGNMQVQDFGGCEAAPCFNIGGADGDFLERLMGEASSEGTLDDLRVHLRLEAGERRDLTAENAVAVVPGTGDRDGNIIVNAHADGWFAGASDNGDGLAVQVALARHFAKRANRPDRTLVFVASAGHHSTGLNGPANFVRMNPGLAENAALVVNLEHVAQLALTYSLQGPPDGLGFRPLVAGTVEEPKLVGISNEAPFLEHLVRRGVARYGMSVYTEASGSVPGDLGGYASTGAPRMQLIQGGPLYHTTGDVAETISTPGLERAARFFAFFLGRVAAAPETLVDP